MAVHHTKAVCWQSAGQVTMFTTFRFIEIAETLEQKQTLAIEVRDKLMVRLKSGCAGTWKLFKIVVSVANNPNDAAYELSTNEVGSGTLHANQTSIQLNLYSGFGGRRGRGRLYIGGIHNAAFVDGLLAGTALAQLTANVATINNEFKDGGSSAWTLGIYSRADNMVRPLKEMVLTRIPASLRSRRIGVGV